MIVTICSLLGASLWMFFFFFFQAEDGIRDGHVTEVQTCALPIYQQQQRERQHERGPKEQEQLLKGEHHCLPGDDPIYESDRFSLRQGRQVPPSNQGLGDRGDPLARSLAVLRHIGGEFSPMNRGEPLQQRRRERDPYAAAELPHQIEEAGAVRNSRHRKIGQREIREGHENQSESYATEDQRPEENRESALSREMRMLPHRERKD